MTPAARSNERQTSKDDENLAYELVDAGLALANLLGARISAVMEEIDLTTPLAEVIWLLDPREPPVPMRRLARQLHCDPSNVTLMATRLEEQGLLQRESSPTDGRVKTLVLTPTGKRIRQRLVDSVIATSPFSGLDPADQRRLDRLLRKALASAGRADSRGSTAGST